MRVAILVILIILILGLVRLLETELWLESRAFALPNDLYLLMLEAIILLLLAMRLWPYFMDSVIDWLSLLLSVWDWFCMFCRFLWRICWEWMEVPVFVFWLIPDDFWWVGLTPYAS